MPAQGYPTYLRFGSLLIGLLVLMNAGGYWLLYQGMDAFFYYQHQQNLHAEMGGDDSKEDLEELTFAKSYLTNPDLHFTWVEDHEFRYKGKMYDIHQRKVHKDSVTFLVERDINEENLHHVFSDDNQQSHNANDKAAFGWLNLLITQAIRNEGLAINPFIPGFELKSRFRLTPLLATPLPENPPPAS